MVLIKSARPRFLLLQHNHRLSNNCGSHTVGNAKSVQNPFRHKIGCHLPSKFWTGPKQQPTGQHHGAQVNNPWVLGGDQAKGFKVLKLNEDPVADLQNFMGYKKYNRNLWIFWV